MNSNNDIATIKSCSDNIRNNAKSIRTNSNFILFCALIMLANSFFIASHAYRAYISGSTWTLYIIVLLFLICSALTVKATVDGVKARKASKRFLKEADYLDRFIRKTRSPGR